MTRSPGPGSEMTSTRRRRRDPALAFAGGSALRQPPAACASVAYAIARARRTGAACHAAIRAPQAHRASDTALALLATNRGIPPRCLRTHNDGRRIFCWYSIYACVQWACLHQGRQMTDRLDRQQATTRHRRRRPQGACGYAPVRNMAVERDLPRRRCGGGYHQPQPDSHSWRIAMAAVARPSFSLGDYIAWQSAGAHYTNHPCVYRGRLHRAHHCMKGDVSGCRQRQRRQSITGW